MAFAGFVGVLLLASVAANNLTTEGEEYPNVYLIPAEENTTCPMGEEIACGSVIDVNGTILRYERGNLTTGISEEIPGEECPWMIRAPLGTRILFQTTCYYHYHNNYSEDHRVCSLFANDIGLATLSKSCGHGYEKQFYSQNNEENFSIYYESGEAFALGFSAFITFIGDPITVTTTLPGQATNTTTTSDGVVFRSSFCSVLLVLVTHLFQMPN